MYPSITRAVLAASVFAATALAFDASSSKNVAVYWGQGSYQIDLATVCSDESIDIVNLAFVNQFPLAIGDYPATNFANACGEDFYAYKNGTLSGLRSSCPGIAPGLKVCHDNGKKVLLSVGGGYPTNYYLPSKEVAQYFAEFLIGAFGPATPEWIAAGKPRPFGNDVAVDGFDLDLEAYINPAPKGHADYLYANYDAFVNHLKTLNPTLLISGAPQCVVPDARMAQAISNSPFDFVYVQFYNTPDCSSRAGYNGLSNPSKSTFTFDNWVAFLKSSSKNPNVKLYLGLPAGTGGAPDDPTSYLKPDEAQKLISYYSGKNAGIFGGVMLWEATVNFNNKICSKPYGSYMKDILNGYYTSPKCASTTSSVASSTSVSRTSSSASTTPTATSPDGTCGGVTGYSCAGYHGGECCSQWGYCGSDSDYCAAGCQAKFGKCGLSSSSSSVRTTSSASSSRSSSAVSSTRSSTSSSRSSSASSSKSSSAVSSTRTSVLSSRSSSRSSSASSSKSSSAVSTTKSSASSSRSSSTSSSRSSSAVYSTTSSSSASRSSSASSSKSSSAVYSTTSSASASRSSSASSSKSSSLVYSSTSVTSSRSSSVFSSRSSSAISSTRTSATSLYSSPASSSKSSSAIYSTTFSPSSSHSSSVSSSKSSSTIYSSTRSSVSSSSSSASSTASLSSSRTTSAYPTSSSSSSSASHGLSSRGESSSEYPISQPSSSSILSSTGSASVYTSGSITNSSPYPTGSVSAPYPTGNATTPCSSSSSASSGIEYSASSSTTESSSLVYSASSSSVVFSTGSSSDVYPTTTAGPYPSTGYQNTTTPCTSSSTSSTGHAVYPSSSGEGYSASSSSQKPVYSVPSSSSKGPSYPSTTQKPVDYPQPSGTKTIYTTSYVDICSTGLTTKYTTVTTTSYPEATPKTHDVPEGWYTTVTVCTHCGACPTTVTLTKPIIVTETKYVKPTSYEYTPAPSVASEESKPYPSAPAPGKPYPEAPEKATTVAISATSTVYKYVTLTKVPIPVSEAYPAGTSSPAPYVPVAGEPSPAPYGAGNGTAVAYPSGTATGSVPYTTYTPAPFEGAASRFQVGVSAVAVVIAAFLVL